MKSIVRKSLFLAALTIRQAHAYVKPQLLRSFGRDFEHGRFYQASTMSVEDVSSTMTKSVNTSTTKVGELVPIFTQVISTADGVIENEAKNDIHVGKLLNAMNKMEEHMRRVGMIQGANDVANNIEKVKRLYNRAPSDIRDSMLALLRWEMEQGVHGRRQKMNGMSAAMGLKWLGHNIRYQYEVYTFVLEGNLEPVEAATQAFDQHVRPHLPRLISMVAYASIPRLVPSTKSSFFSFVGGINEESYGPMEDAALRNDMALILSIWKHLLDEWDSVFHLVQFGIV
jgi:hypothetical protein